jgi:RNA polymerase sigma-70 factor, ECF subfamily
MTATEEFERLAAPLRAELVAYCYRMVGSADEAEDLAQETYLRAWRHYATFEGRSSLRTWLYRIATNVCLNAIERRGRRPLPSGLGAPVDDPDRPVGAAALDVPWLQPFPDPPAPADPGAVVVSRAGVRLALIAALQYLPARQRAVLILRDVLDWPAAETAQLLGLTTTAVNSALRRARDRLDRVAPGADAISEPAGQAERALASRYAAAFHDADLTTLVSLLRTDVALEMPPLPGWYAGAAAVGRFLGTRVLTEPGRITVFPVAANGQPAFASYLREDDGTAHAHAIQVLEVAGDRIARIVIFLNPDLFATFKLPKTLDDMTMAAAAALWTGGHR